MGHGKHGKYQSTADLFGAAASVLDSLVSVQQGKLNQELEMHKIKTQKTENTLNRLHDKEMDKLDFLQGLYATSRDEYNKQKKDYGVLEALPIESEAGKKMQQITKDGYADPEQLEAAISMLGAISTAKETQINSFDTGKLLYQAVDDQGNKDGITSPEEIDAFLKARRLAAEKAGKKFMINPDAFKLGVETSLSSMRERRELASIEASTGLTTAKVDTEKVTQAQITAQARVLNAQAAKEEYLTKGLPTQAQMEIMNEQTIDMADVKIQGAVLDMDSIRKNMELVDTQISVENARITKIAAEVAQTNYLQNKDQFEWTRTQLDATMLFNNEKQGEIANTITQTLGFYDAQAETWKPFLGILTNGRTAAALGDPEAVQESFASVARNKKFQGVDYRGVDITGIGENGELKRFFNAMYLSGVGDPMVTADTYKTLPPKEMIQAVAQIHTEYGPMVEQEATVDKAFAQYYADLKSVKLNSGLPQQKSWDSTYKASFKLSRQSKDFAKFLVSPSSPFQDSRSDTYYRYEQWKHTGFFDSANTHMINSAVAVYNQKLANDGLIEKLVTRGAQYGMMDSVEIYGDSTSVDLVSPISPIIK